jgi:hypothetical protein
MWLKENEFINKIQRYKPQSKLLMSIITPDQGRLLSGHQDKLTDRDGWVRLWCLWEGKGAAINLQSLLSHSGEEKRLGTENYCQVLQYTPVTPASRSWGTRSRVQGQPGLHTKCEASSIGYIARTCLKNNNNFFLSYSCFRNVKKYENTTLNINCIK